MPSFAGDVRRFGPTVAVVAGAAAICLTIVLTRPQATGGEWVDNDALDRTARATEEAASRLEAVERELETVKVEARAARCELQRLNGRIGGGSGLVLDPTCRDVSLP